MTIGDIMVKSCENKWVSVIGNFDGRGHSYEIWVRDRKTGDTGTITVYPPNKTRRVGTFLRTNNVQRAVSSIINLLQIHGK